MPTLATVKLSRGWGTRSGGTTERKEQRQKRSRVLTRDAHPSDGETVARMGHPEFAGWKGMAGDLVGDKAWPVQFEGLSKRSGAGDQAVSKKNLGLAPDLVLRRRVWR